MSLCTVKTLKYVAVLKTISGTDREHCLDRQNTLEIPFPLSPFTMELDNLETNSQPPLHLEYPLISVFFLGFHQIKQKCTKGLHSKDNFFFYNYLLRYLKR